MCLFVCGMCPFTDIRSSIIVHLSFIESCIVSLRFASLRIVSLRLASPRLSLSLSSRLVSSVLEPCSLSFHVLSVLSTPIVSSLGPRPRLSYIYRSHPFLKPPLLSDLPVKLIADRHHFSQWRQFQETLPLRSTTRCTTS